MSDIYLQPTEDGGQLNIINGKPEMTGGIETAVYLSLFTGPWWGNAISESESQEYNSTIPEIINSGVVTNSVRLKIIEAAEEALQWMITDGVAERIEADAEIKTGGQIYLSVTIYEPQKTTPVQVSYGLNWEAQEALNR